MFRRALAWGALLAALGLALAARYGLGTPISEELARQYDLRPVVLPDEPFPITPDTEPVEYAIGNYWPYATTLFDYIRRAMPFGQGGTLTDEEVYHLVAFLLYMNGIIDAGTPVNQKTLPQIRMPARELLELDPEAKRRFPWLTLP